MWMCINSSHSQKTDSVFIKMNYNSEMQTQNMMQTLNMFKLESEYSR